jgi:hypothetical protein
MAEDEKVTVTKDDVATIDASKLASSGSAPDEAEGAEPYLPTDHKYELADLKGLATSRPALVKIGTKEPIEDWLIFRAQDKAVVPMLRQYFKICSKLGSPPEHLEGIKMLINRVIAYQEHKGSKVPD